MYFESDEEIRSAISFDLGESQENRLNEMGLEIFNEYVEEENSIKQEVSLNIDRPMEDDDYPIPNPLTNRMDDQNDAPSNIEKEKHYDSNEKVVKKEEKIAPANSQNIKSRGITTKKMEPSVENSNVKIKILEKYEMPMPTKKMEPSAENSIVKFKTEMHEKRQNRIDYHIKYFKTKFVKWLTDEANKMIPNHLNKSKIHKPNSKWFTSNSSVKFNRKTLDWSVGELFCFSGPICKDLQVDNKRLIGKILSNLNDLSEEDQERKSFFERTLEEAYILFYKSPAFDEYIKEEKPKTLDEEFKIVKKFSLFKPNAFIELIKEVDQI